MQRMDAKTACKLNALTSDFYTRCATSFSSTRSQPWHGWERCLETIDAGIQQRPDISVLDFGCGNLRFEDFLTTHASARIHAYGIDSCTDLLPRTHDIQFKNLDIISTLWDETLADKLKDIPSCDLTCAFGLMHHIPGIHQRSQFLDIMLNKTRPGGYVLVSLWQFERDERLARKARETTQYALERYPDLQLDKGDWLLGWQDESDVLRYCHSFTDAKIDRLITHVTDKAQLVDRFCADGPNDDLNCYLVLQCL